VKPSEDEVRQSLSKGVIKLDSQASGYRA